MGKSTCSYILLKQLLSYALYLCLSQVVIYVQGQSALSSLIVKKWKWVKAKRFGQIYGIQNRTKALLIKECVFKEHLFWS